MENDNDIIFELRDYQDETVKSIDKIYNREDHNRFAAVVMPTGGGKSFVAIQELLSFNNPNYLEKLKKIKEIIKEEKDINDSSMLYVAPSHEILSQVKLHLVRHVILPGQDLKDVSNEKINQLVKDTFPYLKFKCYAGVKEKESKDKDDSDILTEADVKKAQFIILDEAHRIGAEKWGENVKKILAKAANAKILAITATPERQDVTRKEIMATIARMIYPNEIIPHDTYMAKEMYVLDAMKDGIVNAPEVVEFNGFFPFLKSTDKKNEYEKIVKQWKQAKGSDKAKLEKILDEMEEIIGISSKGYPDRVIPPEDLEKERQRLIKSTIQSNIRNLNGKFIAFIPANRDKKGKPKPESKEFFNNYIEEIKSYFDGMLDENGRQVDVSIEVISSNYKAKDNEKALHNFEFPSSTGIHILISQDKLNEGVHVEGIDGVIMLRNTDSSNMYLQQSGRGISSMDKSKPLSEQSSTQLFDFVGNSYCETQKGTGRKVSYSYDITRLNEIYKWIFEENNGKIPNINAIAPKDASLEDQAKCEYEARLACSLKRLKAKCILYEAGNYPIEQEEKVQELLEIAKKINIKNIEIGERVVEPSEDKLLGRSFLSLTKKQERFNALVLEAGDLNKNRADSSKDRITKLMNILKVLKSYKPDLELPAGIMTRESVSSYGRSAPKNIKTKSVGNGIDLKDFLKENFKDDKKTINEIMMVIQDAELLGATNKRQVYHSGEAYNFGEELAFARGKFFTSQADFEKTGVSPFEDYTLKDIVSLGIFNPLDQQIYQDIYEMYGLRYLDYIDGKLCMFKRSDEIILRSKERGALITDPPYSKIKFGVLKQFEEYRHDNFSKYNDAGLDRDGYDEHGFKLIDGKYINRDTSKEYDKNGYKMIYDRNSQTYNYKISPDVSNARRIMTMMVSQGISFDIICKDFSNKMGINEEEVARSFKNEVKRAFEMYKELPNIFDKQEDSRGMITFEGLDVILNSQNSKMRKEKIYELYETFPFIRETIISQSEKNLAKLKELDKKKKLSKEEKKQKESIEEQKEKFDNMELI